MTETNEPKMAKYLGWWIPISDWVISEDKKGIAELRQIVAVMKAAGVGAFLASDRDHFCVYRRVLKHDIDGSGHYFHEWAIGIRTYAVRVKREAAYVRQYSPRKIA